MIRASFSRCSRPLLSRGAQGTTTLSRSAVGRHLFPTLRNSPPCRVQTPLSSIRVAWKHSASKQSKQKKKKKHMEDLDILNSYFEKKISRESKPKHQRREQRKKKKKKVVLPAFEHTTKAPNGRRILMNAHLSEEKLAKLMELDKNAANNRLDGLKHKLRLDFTKSHSAEGPAYDELFYSYNKIQMPAAVVSCLRDGKILRPHIPYATTESDGSLVFQCAGAARSKKQAEWFALLDTLQQFEAMGINIYQPPDMDALFKAQEQEKHQKLVQRSQMLLEMCQVSRPSFSMESEIAYRRGGGHHTATMAFYARGKRIEATGSPGVSKAQAQGNATIEAAMTHLPMVIGQDRVDKYQSLIDTSSDGHVSALRIPKLSDELRELLKEALGDSNEDFVARSLYLKNAHAAYHEKMSARRNNQRASNRERHVRSLSDYQRINQRLLNLEMQRMKFLSSDPFGVGGKTQAIRDALPIKAIQENLIQALQKESVVVVSGGTGSGKSTQCPQYILEDAILNGRASETRIVVTQPRRIAAISVAERIAFERGEGIGNSVGYSVRFRRQPPRSVGGSIEFVTTGVLLRRIINDPALDGISHVVIDEVHERDIDTDFLLVLLRDLAKARPDLRVVLMSATLNADSFAAYFERHSKDEVRNVPTMGVPAKPRHPVEIVHLEDLARQSMETQKGHEWPEEIVFLCQSLLECQDRQIQRELMEADMEEEAASRLKSRAVKEDEGGVSLDSDSESDSENDSDGEERGLVPASGRSPTRAAMLRKAVETRSAAVGSEILIDPSISAKDDDKEISEVTVALVAKLAQHITRVETENDRKGSILCFLPGWDEIKEAMSILDKTTEFDLRRRMTLLPLHSTIPQDDQQKVFKPAEDGKVKVILATNIAESSVTIDDVLVVVDSGLVREMNYNPESVMSTMETVPISRASATQRLGRAGRVAPGKCYRLYSGAALHAMYERSMPEIQRTALEATCLQTCSMTDVGVNNFLQNAMDPPSPSSVQHAMDRLQALGAITLDQNTKKEVLSPLGNILSHLPLDPAIGRMLVIACVMKCLDPILTAVATFSSRDVFYTPLEQRAEQRETRQSLCEHSDLMASVRAYNHFQKVVEQEGWGPAREWAADHFVSLSAMNSIMSIRSQLISELARIGLIAKDDLAGRRRNPVLVDGAEVNQNAHSEYLQVALWASGLPDSLASRRKLGHFGTLRTRTENHAGLHPSSVLFHRKPPEDRSVQLPDWFLYREMIQSSQLFLRGCTAIQPEQIALFGGNVLNTVGTVDTMNSTRQPLRVLDDWILLDGSCQESLDLLAQTRSEIQDALQLKVMEPREPLPESSQKILDAVCQLCTTLGGEMDLSTEGVNEQDDFAFIRDQEKAQNIRERHRQLMRDFFSAQTG